MQSLEAFIVIQVRFCIVNFTFSLVMHPHAFYYFQIHFIVSDVLLSKSICSGTIKFNEAGSASFNLKGNILKALTMVGVTGGALLHVAWGIRNNFNSPFRRLLKNIQKLSKAKCSGLLI